MAKYDLTGSLERDFSFTIDNAEFVMRKPTVREMRELAKVFSAIDKEDDSDKQSDLSEQAMQSVYTFIEPVKHDRRIADVLDEQPVGVYHAFNEMIVAELGVKK
jgi:hypothetical protein